MRKRHLRSRDLPHPERSRKWGSEDAQRRVLDGNGGSWPMHATTVRIGNKELGHVPPKAPVICMLYDDLIDRPQPAKVFGQYPRGVIGKLLPWLRCARAEILHVCSGSLPRGEGIRVDLRRDAHPDILADGRALPLADGSVAAVMLDPPYTEHYARELYGTDYPRPSHLLREAARVVRPGGRIGFVHYITPNPPRGTRFVKCFALSMGFGFPMRSVAIYERAHTRLV